MMREMWPSLFEKKRKGNEWLILLINWIDDCLTYWKLCLILLYMVLIKEVSLLCEIKRDFFSTWTRGRSERIGMLLRGHVNMYLLVFQIVAKIYYLIRYLHVTGLNSYGALTLKKKNLWNSDISAHNLKPPTVKDFKRCMKKELC